MNTTKIMVQLPPCVEDTPRNRELLQAACEDRPMSKDDKAEAAELMFRILSWKRSSYG